MGSEAAAKYKRYELVGSGTFGEVYRALDKENNRIVAIKVLDLEAQQEEIEIIQREIGVMSQLICPYVVGYYTSFMSEAQLWIVMEYMNMGTVREFLDKMIIISEKEKGSGNPQAALFHSITEETTCELSRSVLRGLKYIHAENKVHRDLKAANLLLNDQGGVKLADFGVAGQLSNTIRARNTQVGSPFWMAPEVILQNNYDQSADIWSFGITVYEIVTGRPPHANLHPMKVLFMIPKSDPPILDPILYGKELSDLVGSCLRRNPRERPSAERLLDHLFFKKHADESVTHAALLKSVKRVDLSSSKVSAHRPSPASSAGVASHNADGGAKGAEFSWDFEEEQQVQHVVGADGSELVEESEAIVEKVRIVDHDASLPMQVTELTTTARATVAANSASSSSNFDSRDNRDRRKATTMASANKPVLQRIILPTLARMRGRIASNQAQLTAMARLGTALMDGETAGDGFTELFIDEILAQLKRENYPALQALIETVEKE